MANIDYEKVGWNSSTSLGPTNFGHMDDGIKAACDKLDNIGDEVLGARVVSQGPQHEVINADNATTALNDSLGNNIAQQFSQVNNTLTVLTPTKVSLTLSLNKYVTATLDSPNYVIDSFRIDRPSASVYVLSGAYNQATSIEAFVGKSDNKLYVLTRSSDLDGCVAEIYLRKVV